MRLEARRPLVSPPRKFGVFPLVQRKDLFHTGADIKDALRIGSPLFIPVFEPSIGRALDTELPNGALQAAKAFAIRPYTISLEIGIRSPRGFMREILEFARSPDWPGIGVGFFAAIGDLWRWDDKPIR